jgi:S1-C subfamily serine protease
MLTRVFLCACLAVLLSTNARADSFAACLRAQSAIDRVAQCSVAISYGGTSRQLERALLRRGNALMELNRYANAVDDFSAIIELNPRIAGYYDNRQAALRALGRLPEALRDAETTVRMASGHSFPYRSRALVRSDMGSLGAALDDFTKAVSIDPRDAGLRIERGKVLARTGRLSDAITDFTAALDIDNRAMEALRERGFALRAAGRFEAARDDLMLYARLHPEDGQVSRALEELAGGEPPHPPKAQTPHTAPAPAPTARSSSGTGFYVSAAGHVATNAHVVEGCSEVQIVTGMAPPSSGRVVARDEKNDLAIVLTQAHPAAPAALRAGVRIGETIAAFGYPLTGLLATGGNFTIGNVSAVAGIRDDTRFMQISTPVQPGNSGGPVLDQSGNVVGVVTGKLDAIKIAEAIEDVPQNVNFAIKTTTLINFLDTNGVNYVISTTSAAIPPAEIAEKAKSFSVLISCEH